MTAYCLSPYTIRILDPGGKSQPVDDFFDHYDLRDVMEAYLKGLKQNFYQNEKEEFMLRVRGLELEPRFLHGRMEKGEYGLISELYDTRKKEPSYKRRKDDAELLPYYFLIGVPKKRRSGLSPRDAIAIFQTTDGVGPQDNFEENFCVWFAEQFQGLHIEIGRLIPRQFAEQLLQTGRVTQLHFVKYGVRKDLGDAALLGPIEGEGILEFRLKAKRGKAFALQNQIKKVLSGEQPVGQLLEVKGFHYDDVKIKLESAGKYHTLNLGRLQSTRAPYEYDITKKLGSPGRNPDFAQIHTLALELCTTLALDMGVSL